MHEKGQPLPASNSISLFSLIQIAKEKKVIISLHDPWLLTGRCVHFYKCNKYKNGCNKCEYLNTLFPFEEDNCNQLFKLKKDIFDNIDVDLVVPSNWMLDKVKESPIMEKQKNVHLIPFGIDINMFENITMKEAKKHMLLLLVVKKLYTLM